jgi:hypothetical protein
VTKIPEDIICPFNDLVLLLVCQVFQFYTGDTPLMLHTCDSSSGGFLCNTPLFSAMVFFFVIPCFLQWEAALAVEGFL